MKSILKWIGVVFGILILVATAQFGWGMYREPIAKAQATEFCATVQAGQPTDGIAERAMASGAEARFAKWRPEPDGVLVMLVMYIGMPPFSRHICKIKANTKVISAEYFYLDGMVGVGSA